MSSSSKRRAALSEWGPFFLAVILAAALLIAFALSSPIFQGPAPLPESDPSRSTQAAASSDPPPPDQLQQAPPDAEPPPP